MPDPFKRLREATEAMGRARAEVERIAAFRAGIVQSLQRDGWSLQQIADGLGVSKNAVAKMSKRT